MRRSHFILAAVAAIIGSSTATAQADAAKPNFSGKWTILPDSGAVQQGAARGGAEMGGLGETATIEQTDKTLTITRQTATMGELKTVYNLDGTETDGSVNVQNQAVPLTMKARWDGKALVTSIWANVGQQIEIILVLSHDDKGNLVVEHTYPQMSANSPGGTTKSVYKKG